MLYFVLPDTLFGLLHSSACLLSLFLTRTIASLFFLRAYPLLSQHAPWPISLSCVPALSIPDTHYSFSRPLACLSSLFLTRTIAPLTPLRAYHLLSRHASRLLSLSCVPALSIPDTHLGLSHSPACLLSPFMTRTIAPLFPLRAYPLISRHAPRLLSPSCVPALSIPDTHLGFSHSPACLHPPKRLVTPLSAHKKRHRFRYFQLNLYKI